MKIKQSSFLEAALISFILLIIAAVISWSFLRKPLPPPSASISFQSFAGTVEVSQDGTKWKKPVYGDILKPYDFLKTGADGEADLKYGESSFLRLKENSSFQYVSASRFSKASGRIHLDHGSLLIANKNDLIQVSTAKYPNEKSLQGPLHELLTRFINIPEDTFVLIQASPEKNISSVNTLRGHVTIASMFPYDSVQLQDTEMTEITSAGKLKKNKISQDNWKNAREVYELKPKTASTEAAQIDLAKKAGNFFDYVLDHGTFFQQKWGWCEREFVEPEDHSPVYMETTYDVFPKGSWVGIYLKTRNLDLAKFKTFKFEARKIPGRPFPDFVRLEFKAKSQTIQAFVIKMLHADWEAIEFPIHLSNSTLVNELTFIFTNDKVGTEKSGGFQMRNFTLIPQDADVIAKISAAAKTVSQKPLAAAIGVNASAITKNVSQEKSPLEPQAKASTAPSQT